MFPYEWCGSMGYRCPSIVTEGSIYPVSIKTIAVPSIERRVNRIYTEITTKLCGSHVPHDCLIIVHCVESMPHPIWPIRMSRTNIPRGSPYLNLFHGSSWYNDCR